MRKQSEQGYQKNIHEKGQLKSVLFEEQRNWDSYLPSFTRSEGGPVCWR